MTILKDGQSKTQRHKTVLTSRSSSSPPSCPEGEWQIGSAWTSVRTALYLLSPWQKHMVTHRPPCLDSPSLTVTSQQFYIIILHMTLPQTCIIHASLKCCSHMHIYLHQLSINATWAFLFFLSSLRVSLKPFFTFSRCLLLCHSPRSVTFSLSFLQSQQHARTKNCEHTKSERIHTHADNPFWGAPSGDGGPVESHQRGQSLRHPVGHHGHGAEHCPDF